jgi:hypothetical protein
MKKLDLKNQLIFLGIVLCAFSCKKETPKVEEPEPVNTQMTRGLPANPKKINGYLYAGFTTYINSYSVPDNRLTMFASFGDPARALTSNYNHYTESNQFLGGNNQSNVSVGNIYFNNFTIISNGSTFYNYTTNYAVNFNFEARWATSGKGSFLAQDEVIPSKFPVVNISAVSTKTVINKNDDFVLNLNSFASNYDSVCVVINTNMYDYSQIKKVVPAGVSSIVFSKSELTALYPGSNTTITYAAFNYSNKTINDKVFIYELANRANITTYVQQ